MNLNRVVLAAALTALCPSTRSEAQSRPGITLDDYYRMESASEPALSPDGTRVAFTRTFVDEEENARRREVWLAHTDGSDAPRRITNPAFDSSAPRFSRDGRLLVFRSPRADGSVWFLRLDAGGEAFRIDGVDAMPRFSRDGRWMAFTRETPPASPPPEKSSTESKLDARFDGRVYDWMQYRFDRRGYLPDPTDPNETPAKELYIVAIDGGEAKQVTTLGVDILDFSFSPDGERLIVTADAHQRDEYVYPRADLWLVSLDGSTERLTDDGYNHTSPTFSPDGDAIAFRRVKGLSLVIEAQQHRGAPVDVYTMDLTTSRRVNLTEQWGLRPGRPRFTPDGDALYFTAAVSGDAHLFRVSTGGGDVSAVTSGERRLSGFAFSDDFTRAAFVAEAPSHPGEVFTTRLDTGTEAKLSALNDHWLETRTIARPTRIRYPSADGTEIEGWYLPPAAGTAEPPPLILAIHGGPHGAYGSRFMFEFQLWAAAGYGVVYTNPRGSTGYGEDFLYATWGGWGLKDTEDVLAGADYVIENYAVDATRTGVTGYSYGGFLTNWILGQTTRFRAAIVGAGISNWISDYATADIPRTKESEFYGPPWQEESGALLRRLSPINYVSNMRTPTLFIHGESDFRVPIEQAEQMYMAFKKQRVPAKMIRYPDSYHGGWAPWDMVHRYYHGLSWWQEHLTPGARSSQN